VKQSSGVAFMTSTGKVANATPGSGSARATEAGNALLRYAFGALGMRRIGLTHSGGNEASRRIGQKLGFMFEGVQRGANILPGGKNADRYCYARFDVAGLPDLEVKWQDDQDQIRSNESPRK
jgi:Acetyltransferase (GNAT) domain